MACCAFVAFLLSQAYVVVVALRRALFGALAPDGGDAAAASSWRAGMQVAPAASRPARRLRWLAFERRRLAAACVLSLGSISVAVAFAQASPTSAAGLLSSLVDTVCSGR